jgi:nucleotide-binding universal stress UspA family protein
LSNVEAPLREQGLPTLSEVREGDAAIEILARSAQSPGPALIAMSTHGRTGASRLIFGSVAEQVLHSTPVPLLLLRPGPGSTPPPAPRGSPEGTPRVAITYSRILVPLDGTRLAAQALDPARTIARATGAAITLVAVLPLADVSVAEAGVVPLWAMDERHHEADQVARALDETAAQLAEKGFDMRARVGRGRPVEEILHLCAQEQIDLIVMATHGRGGFARFWYGSVALQVVQRAPVPVYLVRGVEWA